MKNLLSEGSTQSVKINGREVMMKKKKAKITQHMNKKATSEDPLAQLGYGIVAYMNILYSMIWLFILFSLLLIPTMRGYQAGDAYAGESHVGHADGMISNLGYSSSECTNIPISLGSIALTCSYGTIGEIFDYGVNNPATGSPIDACMTNE